MTDFQLALGPVGVCLLILAAYLDRNDRLYSKGLDGIRRLALITRAGYLLLLPLQMSAMWRLGNRNRQSGQAPIANLRRIRDQIAASRTQANLEAALQRLPGAPQLPPGFNRPLPECRKQAIETLNGNLNGLEQQEKRRLQAIVFGEAITLARVSGLLLIFAAVHAQIGGLRPMKSMRRLNYNLAEMRHEIPQLEGEEHPGPRPQKMAPAPLRQYLDL